MWWNPDQFDETHDLCGRQTKVCSLDSLCQCVPGLGANLCFLDLQTTVLQMVSNLRTCSTQVALTHRHLTLLTWCFGYTSQEWVAWPLLFRLYIVDLPIFSFSFSNFSICLGPGHIDTTTTCQILSLFSWFLSLDPECRLMKYSCTSWYSKRLCVSTFPTHHQKTAFLC